MYVIENSHFVVIARRIPGLESGGKWGRSTTLRGALRDAGWTGSMDTFPPGIEVWLNVQTVAEVCTRAGLEAGDFSEWEELGTGEGDRREILAAGDYAPPFLSEGGDTIIHKGELIRIW